jgi:hypothetical protein
MLDYGEGSGGYAGLVEDLLSDAVDAGMESRIEGRDGLGREHEGRDKREKREVEGGSAHESNHG